MNDLLFSETTSLRLDVNDAAFLDAKAEQIRAVAANAVIEIGRHLIEAKERVGHGHFLDWVESEFKWSAKSAENYIRIARLPNSQALLNLGVTREALYLLAGPSVPEGARQDAIDRAQAGDRITKQEAEAMIAERSREVIERTVAEFRANQKSEIDDAVNEATKDLFTELAKAKRDQNKPLDVEGLCKAIENNLNIRRMSPDQYRLLAQLLGQRIAVGKTGYDPVPHETVKQNEENLRITASVTEALQALAGAPSPETVILTAYPVQLSQHRRVCRQVIEWLETYARMLDEQGEINA